MAAADSQIQNPALATPARIWIATPGQRLSERSRIMASAKPPSRLVVKMSSSYWVIDTRGAGWASTHQREAPTDTAA